MKNSLILLMFIISIINCDAKTLGIFNDSKSFIKDGMIQTLKDGGWTVEILDEKNKPLENKETLDKLDVLFLPNGWGAYFYASFKARMCMNDFLADGKGILAGAFRSGYCRTASRPILPEIAASYNRVNGSFIVASGDSQLSKLIDRPFTCGGWDHLVLKTGPLGKVFAEVAGDPVGVYGEYYGGRYIAFGMPIGIDAVNEPMKGTSKNLLLGMLDWLANAPKLSDEEKKKNKDAIELAFLRRELKWDWTIDERGPDMEGGVVVKSYAIICIDIEGSLYTIEYLSRYLSGTKLNEAKKQIEELRAAAARLENNYKKLIDDTRSKIDKMSFQELIAENPYFNRESVNAMVQKAKISESILKNPAYKNFINLFMPRQADRKGMIPAEIPADKIRSIANNLKILITVLHRDEIMEKLFPAAELSVLKERYIKTMADIMPEVNAAKAAKLKAEHAADLVKIPQIIKNTESPDTDVRRDAVLELGRIGAPDSAAALIKLLNDPVQKIRIYAIQGLAWMQSEEAVPALIKLAADNNLEMPVRNRAIQALGQIGDSRANSVILECMKDKNDLVAENAVLAAGWLKIKEAVPELLKIIEKRDKQWGENRVFMMSCIRSLGHIGDKSALPELEEFYKTFNDWPKTRKNIPLVNIYSASMSLGFCVLIKEAQSEIERGGLSSPGIKQADYLASADKFYAVTKRFNALGGRPFDTDRGLPELSGAAILPFVKEAGMTGINNAWGTADCTLDEFFNALKLAGDLDMIWIDNWPINLIPYGSTFYTSNPQQCIEKAAVDLLMEKFKDYPAYAGMWSEEALPCVKPSEFDDWLDKNYGKGYREKQGLSPDYMPSGILPRAHYQPSFDDDQALKTEFLEFCADKLLAHWSEAQEWSRSLRKACALSYSISHRLPNIVIGFNGAVSANIDVAGPESYQSFGRDNAFIMEGYKNGEARPVMCEFYNWYGKDYDHDIRGFYQHLMHGECFFNFALSQVFKVYSDYLWAWDGRRWDAIRTVFQKADKIKEYLNVPQSANNVALLYSERSAVHFGDSKSPLGSRFYQQQSALWTCLEQAGISSDVIWAETISPEKLKRYDVLLMIDAKMLKDNQIKTLRDWVNNGGVLISGGSSTIFDKDRKITSDYGLYDVFGVSYKGFAGVQAPSKNDTWVYPKKETAIILESSMEIPAVKYFVHREIKPLKSLDKYIVTENKYLPGIKTGTACEYDMPLGYDKINLKTAEVIAKFANGDPALTVNKFGKGLCYFWTPIYPGLSYIASDWENDANKKDFWPNVMELLGSMVRGGLMFENKALPAEISGVSKEIELTLRAQPEKNRMMVHLLNYDSNIKQVKSPKLIINTPAGKNIKRIFYPDTDTEVTFKVNENKTEAKLRDFEVYDMAVVEFY